MNQAFDQEIYERNGVPISRIKQNSMALKSFITLLTLCLFISVPLSIWVTGIDTAEFFENLLGILTGPSNLAVNYFALGCLSSTLFNAAICGLACTLILLISRVQANATTFAGYMLIIAHCFYGLNFVNMWPPFIGVLIYSRLAKKSFSENLPVAMFSTALAPFFTDFLFYYPPGRSLTVGGVSVLGVFMCIAFGVVLGFLVPAILPGTSKMHRGFSMYKAGLSIGLLGIFVYCFLYKTFGIEPHGIVVDPNPHGEGFGEPYYVFINVFFSVIFVSTIILGYHLNGKSFKNYRKLLSCSGYGLDFADKFGMPLCLINFGIYGLCILLYLNVIFVLPLIFPFIPAGVGFTGPTAGVVLAALTFSADGQHPRNVAPIALGYTALSVVVSVICAIAGVELPWALSSQGYVTALAFATGLCPIAGVYGFKYGVIAGLVSAIVCTSTASMHGGFVLYNGGFNAGLTALTLIPILDFYKVKVINTDSDQIFDISTTKKYRRLRFFKKK